MERVIAFAVRMLLAGIYVVLSWALCHDGTSVGDATALLAVGAAFAVIIMSLGWIMRGPGQVDREP